MIIAQPKEMIAQFVAERQGLTEPWGNYSALGFLRRGELIAGVIYNQWGASNVCMHVGAIDGCRWMTPGFLYAVFDYPFNQCAKRRITAPVARKNKRARAFIEHIGFKLEGVLPHYFERDDLCCYGMLLETCRFIVQPEKRIAA